MGYIENLVASVKQQTGRTPLELAQEFGKGSPELLAAMNAALPNDISYITASQQTGQVLGSIAGGVAGVVVPALVTKLEPEETVLTDPFSFAPTGASVTDAIFRGISGVIGALGAPTQMVAALPQLGRPPGGGGVVGPQVEVQTGMPISAAGLACTVKRRRYKIVRLPDGSIQAQAYCLPRRMNPLNPRALARAGRRVASFSRIAKGMQQMLERSCRVGARAKRSRSYSCSPKRCR